MLASELAQELKVEAAVISKRLKLLFNENGLERVRILDAQTIEQMRDVDRLLKTTPGITSRTAVQMVLKKYVEPVPATSVMMLDERLHRLEEQQGLLLEKVDLILTRLASIDTPEEESAATPVVPSEAPKFRFLPEDVEEVMANINPEGREAKFLSQMNDPTI